LLEVSGRKTRMISCPPRGLNLVTGPGAPNAVEEDEDAEEEAGTRGDSPEKAVTEEAPPKPDDDEEESGRGEEEGSIPAPCIAKEEEDEDEDEDEEED